MVAIAPNVGRLSRHICFTRFVTLAGSGITPPEARLGAPVIAAERGAIKPTTITSRVIDWMTSGSNNVRD
jgi:hypothetical protein